VEGIRDEVFKALPGRGVLRIFQWRGMKEIVT